MKGNKMHDKMEYFRGFKFGVPVMVVENSIRVWSKARVRLVSESKEHFIIISKSPACDPITMRLDKDSYSYTPIRHSIDVNHSPMGPRFPVCQTSKDTAYCYKGNSMAHIDVVPTSNVNEIK